VPFSFTKLPGLDEERVVALIEPVLLAHHVQGVACIWRTDQGGMVLEITIERPSARTPGEGITIDVCSEVSRDLSVALDVDELIAARYRLEVGSPGLDRALYGGADYARFRGQLAKFRLNAPLLVEGPWKGQRVVKGTIFGVTEAGVEVEVEGGTVLVPEAQIATARLVFDWNASRGQKPTGGRPSKKGAHGPVRAKTRS
jgi:ribosome maturation factor RimP